MNGKKRARKQVDKTKYFAQMAAPEYVVRSEIWLEKSGRLYVDTKRAHLLNLIDEFGSLVAAARTMRLGYNTAWLWVMAMNRLSPCPLVKMGSGGANGGYSVLTPEGRKVVASFRKLNGSLEETMGQIINREPSGPPALPEKAVSVSLEALDKTPVATGSR